MNLFYKLFSLRTIPKRSIFIPKFYLFSIFLFFISINSFSQTWWHTYRNPGEMVQFAYDICQSNDSIFFIVGQKEAVNFMRTNIIKINKNGNVLWSNFYYDSASVGISSIACAPSNDGGCVFTGERMDYIPYAMKIDINGNIVWEKNYNNHNITNKAVQIVKATDNGYIICGLFYLLKIDSSGNYLWSKSNGELGIMGAIYSVVESFDSGYVCLSYQNGSAYPTVTKVDINGNIKWQKTYTNNVAYLSLIRKLSNSYIIMGNTPDSIPFPNTNYKYYFAKLDTAGNEISHHSGFDSTGKTEKFNRGYNVINDNRYIITTKDYTNYSNDSTTYTIFKIVDSTGKIVHKKVIENIHWGSYEVQSILSLNNGYIMYAGMAYVSGVSYDIAVFMARTDTTIYIDPVGIKSNNSGIPEQYKLYQNYPNPFNPTTTIKFDISKGFPIGAFENDKVVLKVYDILGREIKTLVNEKLTPGSYEVIFNGSNLTSGIYFYKLMIGNFTDTKKMILIK